MSPQSRIEVPAVIGGRVVFGSDVEFQSRIGQPFVTTALDLDELVLPRDATGPAYDIPVQEVLDFLGETGRRLMLKTNPYLREALELMVAVSPYSRRIIENCYEDMKYLFDPSFLGYQVDRELGPGALDGWVPVYRPGLATAQVRAFPPRILHFLAGNAPAVAALSIVRGALTKGIQVLKLPSNDLFTATAILRTMADIDPGHPTLRSFSAVYWRGGDSEIEGALIRPQFFDKVVAWGGDAAIRHIKKYLGPGLDLVTFDPKISISLIGHEAFDHQETLSMVAELAAIDTSVMDQEACASSRFHFVEGETCEVDGYCELLEQELRRERRYSDALIGSTPEDVRASVDGLRYIDSHRVWGSYDGGGLVVRSDEPVEFHPTGKTVNVVAVKNLVDAAAYANVATQTVGVYPPERKIEVRDRLAAAGVQHITSLGTMTNSRPEGLPHDGYMVLQRLVRWVTDES